ARVRHADRPLVARRAARARARRAARCTVARGDRPAAARRRRALARRARGGASRSSAALVDLARARALATRARLTGSEDHGGNQLARATSRYSPEPRMSSVIVPAGTDAVTCAPVARQPPAATTS